MDLLARAFQVVSQPHQLERVKEADAFLSECERSPNFCLSLIELARQPEQTLRQQAMICLSNVLKRKWNTKQLDKSFLQEFDKVKPLVRQFVL
jgi:hypothetical protein